MGLKVFFLEIVHPDLGSGKVWGFSIFPFCTPLGEILGLPLLTPFEKHFHPLNGLKNKLSLEKKSDCKVQEEKYEINQNINELTKRKS